MGHVHCYAGGLYELSQICDLCTININSYRPALLLVVLDIQSINQSIFISFTDVSTTGVVLQPCYLGLCQQGMMCPQVLDGGDKLKTWKVAMNIMNR
jgi:hypothetical protein